MTAQDRIRGRMPVVLPLSAIGRSHLGNPGLDVSGFLECRKILLTGWVDVRVEKGCLAGFIFTLLEQAEGEQVF